MDITALEGASVTWATGQFNRRSGTSANRTRSSADLAAVLHAARVRLVVEIRCFPGSRRNPQFTRDRVADELPALGLAYDWRGEALGGRRRLEPGNWHAAWTSPAFRAELHRKFNCKVGVVLNNRPGLLRLVAMTGALRHRSRAKNVAKRISV
jgi:hypothetical protein